MKALSDKKYSRKTNGLGGISFILFDIARKVYVYTARLTPIFDLLVFTGY